MVIGVLLLLPAVFFTQAAAAADWYLRGAFGYEWSRAADFSDSNCAATNPPALFGCVSGNDGQPIGVSGDFGRFPLAEVAVGLRYNF